MSSTRYTTRRRLLEGTAALGAATLILPGKAPAQGGAKPLQGVTLERLHLQLAVPDHPR